MKPTRTTDVIREKRDGHRALKMLRCAVTPQIGVASSGDERVERAWRAAGLH